MITSFDNNRGLRTATLLSITFLLLAFLSTSVLAHPPSSLGVEYNGEDRLLSVEIQHRVGNTSRHYIERVTVSVNGERVLEESYDEQATRSGETLEYNVPAQTGDSIEVVAECNRFGDMSQTIQVEGVPSPSSVLLMGDLGTETEVPPVHSDTPSGASGLAIAILDGEDNTLQYSLVYKGLSGTPTAAHFHRGASGETGPPVKTIFGAPEIEGVPGEAPGGPSGLITGKWSRQGKQPLTDKLEEAIHAGEIYVNVHTELNGGGEIRAQLEKQS
ncbi:CHRD domain-containing protein [Candidatus Bipolaricaulota bacterium]|nr:CHRD domain-containing protein [Candidatus Bipolaricaulota bacterium]